MCAAGCTHYATTVSLQYIIIVLLLQILCGQPGFRVGFFGDREEEKLM